MASFLKSVYKYVYPDTKDENSDPSSVASAESTTVPCPPETPEPIVYTSLSPIVPREDFFTTPANEEKAKEIDKDIERDEVNDDTLEKVKEIEKESVKDTLVKSNSSTPIRISKNETDLIMVHTKTKDFMYIGESYAVVSKYVGELLFHDIRGEIEGCISIFNSKSKIYLPEAVAKTVANRDYIEKSATTVGRIFIKYLNNDNENVWYTGSGFRVSETHIMTSGQLVKQKKKLKLDKIFICFENDTTVGEEIDFSEIETSEYVFELTSILDDTDQPDRKDKLGVEILKFVNRAPSKTNYVLPVMPDPKTLNYFVIAYPGYVDFDEFRQRYKDDSDTKERSTHKCPSLAGFTGGLLGSVRKGHQFVGIHMGGDKYTNENIALSVTHRNFFDLYRKYILSIEGFQDIHSDTLQPYIKYWSEIIKKENDMIARNEEREAQESPRYHYKN
ncbi:hypothetical protein PPL_06846 [Heterostelium album PN500]|uniref:Uncharacterized protein n=1 Tax=Heterostelium pallidum (strain ATCC 26659 / Pp 5 / PN500) TaxID=670386 RepID=D3BDP4_HETP5|nr:hypothetical protein PPL_06846 [Heterostelium album PN500]EFA80025.1 hypothetical protein PPL_06846 [Heterostelium album PN500]|eukprot:XP_020432145.1 hypothetical protein PPL_06846 [Heterostelium album PN500]